MTITAADIRERISSIRSWKAPGTDMTYTYWLKKLTSSTNEPVADRWDPPRLVLIRKDPQKERV